jgi:Ni,Fe-hydrogenase I cytochrome b subunit
LFLKIYILATYVFLFVSNNVGDQLGAFIWHTLVTWVKLCFVAIGKHAIPSQICSKEGYIHLWFHSCSEGLSRPIIYTLYYDTTSSFCTNEF